MYISLVSTAGFHCRFICCMSLHAVLWPASQWRFWHAALQYHIRLHALHRLSACLRDTLAHAS